MSTQTPNLGLTKPADGEAADIVTVNGNMDILDSAVVKSRCWYGECTTAASTAAKTVTCAGFELVKGAMIAVHFSYTNTADEATMNVNSTGAKRIATGNTISGLDNFWYAGEIMMFTYDGTYWRPANMAGINALRDSLSKLETTDQLASFHPYADNYQFGMRGYLADGTGMAIVFDRGVKAISYWAKPAGGTWSMLYAFQ